MTPVLAMTVLFVTTMMPGDRVTGSEVVSATFIETMRRAGHRVVVVAYRRVGSRLEAGEDEVRVADRHIETKGAGLRPYWWMARAFITRLPYSSAKYCTRRYRQELDSALKEYRPELVVIDHAQMAWAAPADLKLPVAYLAHNVENQLYTQAAERSHWPMSWVNRREARHIESVERAVVRRASQVWVLSRNDGDSLQALGSGSPPTVFELPPTLEPIDDTGSGYDVAMLGSWTWDANAAGLRWFIDQVLPLLPPDTAVGVAGAGAEQITARRPNVTYEGRVPDAGRFLAKGRVIAVPSVAGAGVQVKSVDAIGTGKPIVATPLALRGIADVPPTVEAAADPAKFAAALLRHLEDPPTAEQRAAAADWVEARRDAFQSAITVALETSPQEPVPA